VAQLFIHPLITIERNSVVLRNTALGALVALALFVIHIECNGFIAFSVNVRFSINDAFCKESHINAGTAMYTAVHGRVHVLVHGPRTRPVVYTVHTRPCTQDTTARYRRVYGPTRPVHGRAGVDVYTLPPCAWPIHGTSCTGPAHGRLHVHGRAHDRCTACTHHIHARLHGPYTVVYMAV